MPSRKALREAQTEEEIEHVTIGEGDAALHVSYRGGMISPRVVHALEAVKANPMEVVDSLVAFIESAVVEWDMQDEEDGPPIPLTYAGISRVEVPLLSLVVKGIIGVSAPGEANGTPSLKPIAPPSIPEDS